MNNKDRVWRWLEEASCKEIREGSGGNLVSSCPFHTVKSGTQFSISYETGAYLCFSGSCGASGNIITFLVRALDWKWEKATWAAQQFQMGEVQDDDLELPYDERNEKKRPDKEVVLSDAILGVYDFCPKYMLERGFTKETLRRWEIGYDHKTKRVTIPVRNELGQLVGFSKRGTRDYQQPKYLHLNFSKGDILFGQSLYRHVSRIWITEGQLDTLALDQLGTPSTSTMGTRISKQQVNMMSKYKEVVLAFDNPDVDIDGRVTTLKIGEELLKRMDPDSIFVPRYPKNAKDSADVLKKSERVQQRFLTELEPFDRWRLRS